jgi:hypothetical protein
LPAKKKKGGIFEKKRDLKKKVRERMSRLSAGCFQLLLLALLLASELVRASNALHRGASPPPPAGRDDHVDSPSCASAVPPPATISFTCANDMWNTTACWDLGRLPNAAKR